MTCSYIEVVCDFRLGVSNNLSVSDLGYMYLFLSVWPSFALFGGQVRPYWAEPFEQTLISPSNKRYIF